MNEKNFDKVKKWLEKEELEDYYHELAKYIYYEMEDRKEKFVPTRIKKYFYAALRYNTLHDFYTQVLK